MPPLLEDRLDLVDARHVEVGELRAKPPRVDDAIAEVAARKLHVRCERRLDETGVGMRPRNARQHPDKAALVEPVAARAPGDLCDLPRFEVAALAAVELLRLREEQRLAREIDAVAEHVGGHAHLGGTGEKPVDLLTTRREWHRAVKHGDASRPQGIQLARKTDHRAPAERDDNRSRPEPGNAFLPEPLERRLALEETDVDLRECMLDEQKRLDRAEQQDVTVLAAEHQPRPRGAALLVLG